MGCCGLIDDRCGVICGNFGFEVTKERYVTEPGMKSVSNSTPSTDTRCMLARQDLEDSLVDESTCEDDARCDSRKLVTEII